MTLNRVVTVSLRYLNEIGSLAICIIMVEAGQILSETVEKVRLRQVPPLDNKNSTCATLRGHLSNS